jgi:hypothetical protein
MHGCSMGSVGRQTAAWVHGLRAMRAMPCVSCMHHHEAHSRPTPSSVGPWANTPQHMLMPTHALARHASRGVCQQLWLRMRRPEALSTRAGATQPSRWLGVNSSAPAMLAGVREAATGVRRLQRWGRRLEGGLLPRPQPSRTASAVECAMRRVLPSTPLNTAWQCPPPELLRPLLPSGLTAVTSPLPTPQASGRTAMVHILCLLGWQLPCHHTGSLEEHVCGDATMMLPPLY